MQEGGFAQLFTEGKGATPTASGAPRRASSIFLQLEPAPPCKSFKAGSAGLAGAGSLDAARR